MSISRIIIRNVSCDVKLVVRKTFFVDDPWGSVNYYVDGGTAVVSGSTTNNSSNQTITMIGNGNVVSSVIGNGNGVVVGGANKTEMPKRVTIGVPKGTSVHTENLCGTVDVGDIKTPLNMSL